MTAPQLLSFPPGFLWGTATSSHQVEGDNTGNDWWDWEQLPDKIHDGTRSGHAARWWSGRAEDDLRTAAELGQNAHRLSLEWSRLQPEPSRFDDKAFDRYRAILDAARALGMKTMVTLNHFTLPRWVAAEGAWLARGMSDHFARLAREAADRLGDRVDLWATLNEPSVVAYMGYAGRSWPPGAGSIGACYRALATMLRAHAAAYRALSASKAPVGIVLNLPAFDPARHIRADEWVTRARDWAFNGVVLHALEHGVLLPPIAALPKRVEGLARSFDWIGINYYGRYRVRFDPRAAAEIFGRHVTDDNVKTRWTDWGEIHPAGLTRQLVRLSRLEVPLYVTENGVYDNTDRLRADVIVKHVRAVHDAIRGGADVRGYFHWSLIDNFEWAEGWSTHFGLIELDRATQSRRKRPSADVYAGICRENAVSSA